jgi:5-oxoprolinase (ATP-hydrolysing)
MARGWQFWIDRGGTFTDVVARRPDGALLTKKLLSENPGRYADAGAQAVRELLAGHTAFGAAIDAVKMGTTVATNALLERRGDRTLLVITRGFGDALRIGYQNRPDIFARRIVLPELLYERVVEADERIDAHGEVLRALDEAALEAELAAAHAAGIRAVAVVFMHGYRYPQHERAAAAIAGRIGYTQISASHEVSPLMKLVSRGDTTVVDAYLSPMLRRYVDSVSRELGPAADGGARRLLFMQSHGGLTDAACFRGKDAILSGPAGGVVGMARAAAAAGMSRVIGFDMGGTSTDVSLYDGAYERAWVSEVAGVRLRAPMMRIHTIAAGGGSLLRFADGRFQVGPESAGADPGPACYRRGGPLTITDANVLLGRIPAAFFPRVFGPAGDEPVDREAATQAFGALTADVSAQTGRGWGAEEVAEGFLRVAVENMANAIRRVSLQRGRDVTEYGLCCFGGAAGQHACLVADALGMTRVLIHPLAGVLSAYGMGLAELRSLRQRAVEAPLGSEGLPDVLAELADGARAELVAQGADASRVRVERRLQLRYAGTDTSISVDHGDDAAMREAFAASHRSRFGFLLDKPLVVEAAIAEAICESEADVGPPPAAASKANAKATPVSTLRVRLAGAWREAPCYQRVQLTPGETLDGPAIIAEAHSTTVVEPGWRAEVTPGSELLLVRRGTRAGRARAGTRADPVMLEVFNNLFMHIAEQMGTVLESTAQSVNIKERLDFSCAIFDAQGRLIANAPHIPVHLGSMGESVAAVLCRNAGRIARGDVYMLNAPYDGGTHLPDITVVTPVLDERARVLFVVASRAHHADIGGITPGSMPPESTSIDEEGVLFENFKLIEDGRLREQPLRDRLGARPWPARNVEQNLADLRAQAAANEKGVAELRRMVGHYGLDVVRAYMRHVRANAEDSVRRVIDVIRPGRFEVELDTGQRVCVDISIDREARAARIDFGGSATQGSNNFNAPKAVCKAAVLYVFRTLVDRPIPLNAGCLEPLEVVIPPGSLLDPRYPAAVVAGNVETSQCVTDALYGALGIQAGAQGTMNNFTFGNERHQYYETICGGAGAGPGYDGADAVHTHMTNSRLTDPEVLEWRFPVLIESFSIRRSSGGAGRHRGGDGVVRRILFREAMTASILSNNRRMRPFGLEGGEPGQPGRNGVLRADGSFEELTATASVRVEPGDVFVIETPGGGGYGARGSISGT